MRSGVWSSPTIFQPGDPAAQARAGCPRGQCCYQQSSSAALPRLEDLKAKLVAAEKTPVCIRTEQSVHHAPYTLQRKLLEIKGHKWPALKMGGDLAPERDREF